MNVTMLQLIGTKPDIIVTPFSTQQHSWLWQPTDTWQIAFANFPGQIESHYPHVKVIQFALHLFLQRLYVLNPL